MQSKRLHINIVHRDESDDSANMINTAVELLANKSELSKQKIKLAMKHGAVWLTQGKSTKRLRRATKKLKNGDIVDMYYDWQLLKSTPPSPILIKDEGLYSVWYKPYGLLSQGSKWGDFHTINRYAELNLKPQRPAFIVHRLDRAANGLILIAHSKQAAAKLSKLFQDRDINKYYKAIVEGDFSKNKRDENTVQLKSDIDNKNALSIAEFISYDSQKNISLLSVKIETGRKHQIRKHLSEFGFPILGDRLYGNAKSADTNLQLSSVFLSFTCPLQDIDREYTLAKELQPNF
jgi:tRNA pseudouridine32 synthase/23S rRNA pseudouridine746 synthase